MDDGSRRLTFAGPASQDAPASSEAVSARMARTGRRDTKPEIALRSHLHALGLRYRVDKAVLPDKRRRVDVVFGPARVAVFVDGCFWHGCPEHGTLPRTNATHWREKIEANRARDADTNSRLAEAGWAVVRLWEHEDMAERARDVQELVRKRRDDHEGPGRAVRSPVSLSPSSTSSGRASGLRSG